MIIEPRSLWSIYAGKYQHWFNLVDHGIADVGVLTTPSFYTDGPPEEVSPYGRDYVGVRLSTKEDVWFRLTRKGLKPKKEKKEK